MEPLKRSWVNLFTNRAFVKNLEDTTITNILFDHRFPKEVFFSFIHEATHHWCFDSILGNLYYFLKNRGYLNSLEVQSQKSAQNYNSAPNKNAHKALYDHLYSDTTKYRTFDQVIKPLYEGMALFSEYDLRPSNSEVTPVFMPYVTVMFSGYSRFDFNELSLAEFEMTFSNFLRERRVVSGEGIRNKALVFSSAISLRTSPYLAGYLFVKNLQKVLITKSEKFTEESFFLQFLKSYYFDDVIFATSLIDPSLSIEDIVPTVIRWMNMKTASLLELSPKKIAGLETNYLSSDPLALHKHLYSEEGIQFYFSSWNNQLGHLSSNHIVDDLWFMRSFFNAATLNCYLEVRETNIMVYLRLPADMESDPTIHSFINNRLSKRRGKYIYVFTCSFPNKYEYKEMEGEAVYEKYTLFANPSKKFDVFLLQDKQIFFPFEEGLTPDEIQRIYDYFEKVLREVDTIDFDKTIDAALDRNDPLYSEIDEWHECNWVAFYDWFESLAINCPSDRLDFLREIMKVDGFLRAFDNDVEMVYLLAYVSLVCSNCCRYLETFNIVPSEVYTDDKLRQLHDVMKSLCFSNIQLSKDTICTQGI